MNFRRIGYKALRVVGGSLLQAAMGKVFTLTRKWFVMRFDPTAGVVGGYLVYAETGSVRQAFAKAAQLFVGGTQFSVAFFDGVGNQWYLQLTGSPPPR